MVRLLTSTVSNGPETLLFYFLQDNLEGYFNFKWNYYLGVNITLDNDINFWVCMYGS